VTALTSRSKPWLSVGLPPRYLGAILCVLSSAISQVRKKFWGSGRGLKLRVFGIHRYRGGSGVTTNVIRRLNKPLDCCTTALSTPQMRDGERRQFAEGLIAGSVSLEHLGYIFEAHRYEDLYLGCAIHALLPLTRPIRPLSTASTSKGSVTAKLTYVFCNDSVRFSTSRTSAIRYTSTRNASPSSPIAKPRSQRNASRAMTDDGHYSRSGARNTKNLYSPRPTASLHS
jgi:hypothetical protein